MTSYLMLDASNPVSIARMPAGCVAAAGYIGGDTPHVWTRQDWGRFNGWRKLPIWTRSNPVNTHDAGAADAFAAVHALWVISAGIPQVRGTPIGLDLEAAVAPAYVGAFGSVCGWTGFGLWAYGSVSSLVKNGLPARDEWGADWTGMMHVDSGEIATQYTPGGAYDTSELSAAGYAELKVW